ncbi:hypothetical protein E2C01_059064 [Portunus trituberculatus]|uniref:Uncharacterized protein n=1 Tax=Portunus trituberculatus TaxID=210409 RepID=A0A5B7H1I6_PORTR|nr:hypothetical protein [Portunus trituberculatus]
MTFLTSVHLIT